MGRPSQDFSETVSGYLDSFGRFCFYAGLIVLLPCAGFLFLTYQRFSGGNIEGAQDAIRNVAMLNTAILVAGIMAGIGCLVMFYDEQGFLGIFVVLGVALFFSPLLFPLLLNSSSISEPATLALEAMRNGGIGLGGLTVAGLLFSMAQSAQLKMKQGSKADQLKYGKNMREELEKQNVFLGKCWQLPYCRKFVREKCPIFHAKRTCWRERVGCMCEEKVIRDAMSSKVVPKDALMAATYIPQNLQLPMAAKKERCRQCVIYNEHQKHKYKLALPVVTILFLTIYILGRGPSLAMGENLVLGVTKRYNQLTYQKEDTQSNDPSAPKKAPVPHEPMGTGVMKEIIVGAIFLMGYSYAIKGVEFAIFKLKI